MLPLDPQWTRSLVPDGLFALHGCLTHLAPALLQTRVCLAADRRFSASQEIAGSITALRQQILALGSLQTSITHGQYN